jgi:formate/nitrite transporter FocA (FNT family)
VIEYPILTAFVKAIFAGWLMTLLTWLLLAAPSFGARLFMIWMIGFLLIVGRFGHVIISSSEVFIAFALGAPLKPLDWLIHTFFPATTGNILGGVVFVTLLHYIQVQYTDERRQHPFRS